MAEYDRCHRAVLSQGGHGRRPYPLETMLRIHCMQHWYNLSDGAMEDALYEIASMRLFARLSLDSALPDRTTIMNFRHLLEQHQLARQLFKTINRWLAEAGVMMTKALWWMPPSLRHPALPRTKSSNAIRDASDQERQSVALWHEGPHWCRCQEWPDPQPSHRGQRATSISWVICFMERSNLSQPMPATKERHSARSCCRGGCGLADRRASRQGKTLKQHPRKNKTAINIEYMKASIRARVEHPFRIIKRQFGFVKARYRGC